MKRWVICTIVACSTSIAAGCFELEHKSSVTSPSDLSSLLGTWSSSSVLPSPDSCTAFHWEVTQQSGPNASGTFSASCPGGLTLTGTASGTLLGSTISWTANGAATAPNLPACTFTLSGTAYLETDRIRVPYSGQTCLGQVRGEEILNRH